jgi:hypothetical protein
MAEENQSQESQVSPADARKFIEAFVPDSKMATTMADPDVLAYHGKVKTAMDTHMQSVLKERGDFSPEWRKSIAGDDSKALDTLNRFQTPKALWESYAALRGKVSNGELKAIAPYPANGTPEQQNAWRADAGIPIKPEEYKIEPPAGVVIGEEDKPFIDGWQKFAHGKNMSNEAVNAGVAWWAEQRQARIEAHTAQQAELKQQTEDKLRTDWGPEYRPSMSRIEGLLDGNLPKDSPMKEAIMESVKTSPDFANFIAKVAFQLNPSATPMLPGGEDNVKSVEDWLSKADKLMRTDRTAYNKGEYSRDYAQYANAYKAQTGKEWGK